MRGLLPTLCSLIAGAYISTCDVRAANTTLDLRNILTDYTRCLLGHTETSGQDAWIYEYTPKHSGSNLCKLRILSVIEKDGSILEILDDGSDGWIERNGSDTFVDGIWKRGSTTQDPREGKTDAEKERINRIAYDIFRRTLDQIRDENYMRDGNQMKDPNNP